MPTDLNPSVNDDDFHEFVDRDPELEVLDVGSFAYCTTEERASRLLIPDQ